MAEKKLSIKHILLIFFVVHLVFAFFLDDKLELFKKDDDTGKFHIVRIVPGEREGMQAIIGEDIQPDVYVKDHNDEVARALKHNAEARLHNEIAERENLLIRLQDEYSENHPEDAEILVEQPLMDYVDVPKAIDPTKFTYGSQTLYDLFTKMFGGSLITEEKDGVEKMTDGVHLVKTVAVVTDEEGVEKAVVKWDYEQGEYTAGSAILNFRLWRMLLYLDIFFILLALYIRGKLSFIPSKVQLVAEMAYNFLEDLVLETLGPKNRVFVAYFVTLFFFIWFSNQSALLPIPGISEPTRNLNVPLGLGLMVMAVVQYMAIKKKGIVEWGKAFCEPLFFMLPLNIVGEASKIISISFRLFGNIFGGAIIYVVVSSLTMYIVVPVGLSMFFTMFAGTIQAFVFTMLAMTYLSLEIAD